MTGGLGIVINKIFKNKIREVIIDNKDILVIKLFDIVIVNIYRRNNDKSIYKLLNKLMNDYKKVI